MLRPDELAALRDVPESDPRHWWASRVIEARRQADRATQERDEVGIQLEAARAWLRQLTTAVLRHDTEAP